MASNNKNNNSNRGLASADEETRERVARAGGEAAPRRHGRHLSPGLPERGREVEGDATPPAHPHRRHG